MVKVLRHIGGGRWKGGSTVVKAVVDKKGGGCVNHLLSIARFFLLFTLMTRMFKICLYDDELLNN